MPGTQHSAWWLTHWDNFQMHLHESHWIFQAFGPRGHSHWTYQCLWNSKMWTEWGQIQLSCVLLLVEHFSDFQNEQSTGVLESSEKPTHLLDSKTQKYVLISAIFKWILTSPSKFGSILVIRVRYDHHQAPLERSPASWWWECWSQLPQSMPFLWFITPPPSSRLSWWWSRILVACCTG